MKLEDIHAEWAQDCQIDTTNIISESVRTGPLHAKYWKILAEEKARYEHVLAQYNKLYDEKFNFFMNGPDEETVAKGWKLPAKGKSFVKDEARKLVEIDDEIIELTLKKSLSLTKLELIESILKQIANRSYTISNIIQWMKFQNGA